MSAIDQGFDLAAPATTAVATRGLPIWARTLANGVVRKFAATRSAYATAGLASSPDELDELVAANAAYSAQYYSRLLGLIDRRKRRRMQADVDAADVALLDEALERGRGAIVVSGHIGEFDLAASWLAQVRGLRVVVPVARVDSLRQPLFDSVRRAAGLELVPATATTVRQLERVLAKNGIIVLMLDRRPAVAAPSSTFFGHTAAIARTPALLALRSGAPIITAAAHSVGGRPLISCASLFDASAVTPGSCRDRVCALTDGVVADLEAMIASHPEQWHVPADRSQMPWL